MFLFFSAFILLLGNKSTCSYAFNFNIALCHLGIFVGCLPYKDMIISGDGKEKSLANDKVS